MKRWGIPDHGMIDYQTVSPGYFAALRIPVGRGRVFDERDGPEAPFFALVNQVMVRKFFPDEDPIGRPIVVDRGTSFLRRMTIVGVVADVRLDGLDHRAQPEVFAAMAQLPSEDTWIVARASGDTKSIGRALQKAVHDVDPEIGIVETIPMFRVIADSLWSERFSALLIASSQAWLRSSPRRDYMRSSLTLRSNGRKRWGAARAGSVSRTDCSHGPGSRVPRDAHRYSDWNVVGPRVEPRGRTASVSGRRSAVDLRVGRRVAFDDDAHRMLGSGMPSAGCGPVGGLASGVISHGVPSYHWALSTKGTCAVQWSRPTRGA